MTSLIQRQQPPSEWIEIQKQIRTSIIEQDDTALIPLTHIGGVDISFIKHTNEALSAFVVMTWPELEIVHQDYRTVTMTEPYISGYLAFREVNHLAVLINDLKRSNPSIYPQVIMVDGNGILHPTRCGLASHLGVVCDVATIGIGKNLLQVDGITQETINEWKKTQTSLDVLQNRTLPLIGTSSGILYGAALCISNVQKPIYVSVGHRISLQRCLEITIQCSEFRIPTPIRAADLGSREILREREKERKQKGSTDETRNV